MAGTFFCLLTRDEVLISLKRVREPVNKGLRRENELKKN